MQSTIRQNSLFEFTQLTEQLDRGGAIAPDTIRRWCHLGIEHGQPAIVQNVCQNLLAPTDVHPALRPYWLYFLGIALLHQLKIDEAVTVLHQGLESLCLAPRVYNPRPVSSQYADPRIEALLWESLAQLAAGNVRAFAHAGTLLGLVREKRLLPFDKDLDLGLMRSELALAHIILSRNGWHLLPEIFHIENMASYRYKNTDIVIDLCGFEQEPSGENLLSGFRINGGQPATWQRVTRYPGPLRLELFSGPAGKVWRLKEPASWLETIYGNTWQIPDPGFDTIIGAHNLIGFSSLTRWYAYSRIINSWLEGYWEKALQLTRQVLERHVPNDQLLIKIAHTLELNLRTRNIKP